MSHTGQLHAGDSRILPPVNQVSSATADGVSGYKYGAKGVIPAKFRITCGGDLVDTLAEATALGDGLFRFDDDGDLFIYNINIKGRAVDGYEIKISGGGDTQVEYFRIV